MPYTYHINSSFQDWLCITYYFLLEHAQNYIYLITYVTRTLEKCLISTGKDILWNK